MATLSDGPFGAFPEQARLDIQQQIDLLESFLAIERGDEINFGRKPSFLVNIFAMPSEGVPRMKAQLRVK